MNRLRRFHIVTVAALALTGLTGSVAAAGTDPNVPTTTIPLREPAKTPPRNPDKIVQTPSGANVKVPAKKSCNATDPLLRPGSRGAAVRKAQRLLTQRGLTTRVTGQYGSWTEYQVRQFQMATDWLAVDGRVGKCTWTALMS